MDAISTLNILPLIRRGSMYAIIRAGGRQYRVREGDRILVERETGEAGDPLTFGDVLLLENDGAVHDLGSVGDPLPLSAEPPLPRTIETEVQQVGDPLFRQRGGKWPHVVHRHRARRHRA